MELKLDVYDSKGGSVVKTYTCHEFHILTGTCEDLLEAVNIDSIINENKIDAEAIGMVITKLVTSNYKKFRPILINCFDGLTEEEFKHTDVTQVVQNIIKIIMFVLTEMFAVTGGASKKMRGATANQ